MKTNQKNQRSAAEIRRAELAAIHAAKRDLGMDDDVYRNMLEAVAGVRSAKDLSHIGRQQVLNHMKQKGWKKPSRSKRPTAAVTKKPLLKKIYALLGDKPVAYAEGILRNMFKDDAPAKLEWATENQLHKVVAALTYQKQRQAKQQ